MGLIRIFLALVVVIWHLEINNRIYIIPGTIAVELFFIISGYYMAMVLKSDAYSHNSRINILNFYKSRFYRLYPAFISISIISILYYYFVWWMLGNPPATSKIYSIAGIGVKICAFLSNVTMLGQDLLSLFHVLPNGEIRIFYSRNIGMTEDGSIWMGQLRIINQAWSIGTEIWFYILVPFISNLKYKHLFIIAFLSFSLKIIFELILNYETYFFFPTQLYLFIFGMLSFLIELATPKCLIFN